MLGRKKGVKVTRNTVVVREFSETIVVSSSRVESAFLEHIVDQVNDNYLASEGISNSDLDGWKEVPVRSKKIPLKLEKLTTSKSKEKSVKAPGVPAKSRLAPDLVPIVIGGDQLSAWLPTNFTHLNIAVPRNVHATPDQTSRTAKTTPAALLHKLHQSIELVQDHNAELSVLDRIKGNIACGQLSIIPHDKKEENLYLNIRSSDSNGVSQTIVAPDNLYGESAETFGSFSKYHLNYLDSDLLRDPVIRGVFGLERSHGSRHEREKVGHEIREETHHTEQFFIAAIYKTLLALKEAKTLSDSTFILDIATDLAPCDHCIKRINDFFNHLRSDVYAGDHHYFVARITWHKSYNHGNSPSTVSRMQMKSEGLSYDKIEICDPSKNYVLTFRATHEIAANSDISATNSGKAAAKSSACLSSKNRLISRNIAEAQIGISFRNDEIMDSPPKSKNPNISPDKIRILRQGLERLVRDYASFYEPDHEVSIPAKSGNDDMLSPSIEEDDMQNKIARVKERYADIVRKVNAPTGTVNPIKKAESRPQAARITSSVPEIAGPETQDSYAAVLKRGEMIAKVKEVLEEKANVAHGDDSPVLASGSKSSKHSANVTKSNKPSSRF